MSHAPNNSNAPSVEPSPEQGPALARSSSGRLVRLSGVMLTEKQAEVFFNMLEMSAGEPSDVDHKQLSALLEKFTKARKPNTSVRQPDPQ